MFEVWFTPIGREDYSDLRADLRAEVDAAPKVLERRGCRAADYRLSGAGGVDRICVIHLSRDWRLIVGFPAEKEVTILLIGRHLPGALSVYRRLYLLMDIAPDPVAERKKPPCCSDGKPPVDQQLIERIVANAKQLQRS